MGMLEYSSPSMGPKIIFGSGEFTDDEQRRISNRMFDVYYEEIKKVRNEKRKDFSHNRLKIRYVDNDYMEIKWDSYYHTIKSDSIIGSVIKELLRIIERK